MIIKKEQLKVVMPPDVYDVFHMYITDHNGLIFALQRVHPPTMEEIQKTPKDGRPTFFCFAKDVITLYPRPDKDYPDVTLEYLNKKQL